MAGAKRKASAVTQWKRAHRSFSAHAVLKRKHSRRFVIVAAAFNGPVTQSLLEAALKTLVEYGIPEKHIRVIWTPGSFEVPCAVARALRLRPKPDAVITLGSLIQGETIQYEVIANSVAVSLQQLAAQSGVPVTFGIVLASTVAQARARAGGEGGNRGEEAAQAALRLLEALESGGN